jgi:DNA-binding transcriptional ArsR family regulator
LSHSSEIAERIITLLKEEPMSFYAILQSLKDVDYRVILQAWGILREKDLLSRDEEGRYLLHEGE